MRRVLFIFHAAVSAVIALAPAPALAIDLVLWKPGPGHPTMVLPAVPGLSADASVQRYLRELRAHPERWRLGDLRSLKFPAGQARIVSRIPEPGSGGVSFAVLANRTEHLSTPPAGPKMRVEMTRVSRQLSSRGAEVYVIPINPDLGLEERLVSEFREKLAVSFDAYLNLGSRSDVHPAHYGEQLTHANREYLTPISDAWRIDMTRRAIRAEHGVYYGICNGHQVCAVAQGGKLVQDIEKAGLAPASEHSDTWHLIRPERGSFLRRMAGKDRFAVRSNHHQAVEVPPGAPVKVVARGVDGTGDVIEAMEFLNGLGVTFQFHPEYMDTRVGRRIMTGLVRHVRNYRVLREAGFAGSASCLRATLWEMLGPMPR